MTNRGDTGLVVSVTTYRRAVESVPRARRHVRALLGRSPAAEDLELAVAELMSNSVRHAGGDHVTVTLAVGDHRLRAEVTDAGSASGHPELREVSEDSENCRGLVIVRALSIEWGVSSTGRTVSVWCEIATSP